MEHAEQGTLRLVAPARVIDGQTVDGSASLILQEFDAAAEQGERDAQFKVLQRVQGAPKITFPLREQKVLPIRFSLSLVDDADAKTAGAGFAAEINVPLIREALTASRNLEGGVDVRRQAQRSETATQEWVPLTGVVEELENRVLALGLVEESLPEYNATKRVVKAFLAGAGAAGGTDVNWGAERAHQAVTGIAKLIEYKYRSRQLQPEYQFRTISLPAELQLYPTDVHDRYDHFERGRWYTGWTRSVLPVASFDAKSTEYVIAGILDNSPNIAWWLRLRIDDGACIELDAGGRYYPDFIALDTDGGKWLIEGKSDNDAQRADVLIKREAARTWARFVNDDSRFGRWQYLFCTESAIKSARGGWEGLLVAART